MKKKPDIKNLLEQFFNKNNNFLEKTPNTKKPIKKNINLLEKVPNINKSIKKIKYYQKVKLILYFFNQYL